MNIKYLLVFCLGATAGSIFTARFLDEKYSKIADEEIESVKEVAKKTIDELKKQVDEFTIAKSKPEKIPEEKNEKTMYHNLSKEYMDEEVPIGLLETIDEKKYSEDGDFEKMTLWFYGIDKALINDNEQPVDNADECVGRELIEAPGLYFKNNNDTVYLRNHEMGIDFEVIYLDKSYSRDVLGLEE